MDFLGPTVHFIDTSIHDQLLCLRGNEVIVIFKLITGFGNWQFILLSLFILTLVLHLRSLQRYIFSLYIGLISSTIVTFLMKLFVARPCPID